MAIEKHPAEVFGYPVDVNSSQAQDHRKRCWCPFVDQPCDKQSRLIDYPMGVCSVCYGEEIVALSPRRFLQDSIVFRDIADHYFGGKHDLLIFDEISVPSANHLGRFDYVMVKHKPMSSEIEDFVVIEFQTGQTTSTGKLVEALEDFMQGRNLEGTSYGFGLNLADIWKRAFTQVLTKGITLERWGHKIYWIVQEPVYKNLLDRYQLHGMDYRPNDATVFMVYDLERVKDEYQLVKTRVESSSVNSLFEAFRNNLEVPSKDAFVKKLESRVKANLHLKFQLGLE